MFSTCCCPKALCLLLLWSTAHTPVNDERLTRSQPSTQSLQVRESTLPPPLPHPYIQKNKQLHQPRPLTQASNISPQVFIDTLLNASGANGLGSRQHALDARDAAVGEDAAGGSGLQVAELAAHAGVVGGVAADVGGRGQDAGVLFFALCQCFGSFATREGRGLTPQRGMLSASGQSARLERGVAAARVARVVRTSVENCILVVEWCCWRWVKGSETEL